jgi:hypothetical protein
MKRANKKRRCCVIGCRKSARTYIAGPLIIEKGQYASIALPICAAHEEAHNAARLLTGKG